MGKGVGWVRETSHVVSGTLSSSHRWLRRLSFPLVLGVMVLVSAYTSTFTPTSAAPSSVLLGSASVAEFHVPRASSAPDLLVTAPDGTRWFTEVNSNPARVRRITAAGATRETALRVSGAVPFGLAWGPDGNL